MKYFALLLSLISIAAILPSSAPQQRIPPQQAENIYNSDHAYEQPDGGTLRFSSFKGKVVLVHVWAYWCETTRGRPQALAQLEKKINNSNFEIVHVAMDSDRIEWRQYIKDNNWKGHHIMYQDNLNNPLSRIIYVPKEENGQTTYWIDVDTFFLIDKKGIGKETGITTSYGRSDLYDKLEEDIRKAL